MNQHLLSLYSISYLHEKIIYKILFNYQPDNKKKNCLAYFTDKNNDPQKDYMIGRYAGVFPCLLTISPFFSLPSKVITIKVIKP